MTVLAQFRDATDHVEVRAPALASPERTRQGDAMNVTIDHIVKTFGKTPALHGVSLDIEGGELIALLGPSGSGKTTLLRVIAGLEMPTSGRVLFGDDDASHKTVQDRNVGFVFQSYALFRHMTVFENIAFGLRVRPRRSRFDEKEIRSRVTRLIELVQLGGLEGRYPGQLSGGQQQRVALARALAIEPRVLLLDEPFGALDAKVRKDLRRWLRQLHDEINVTSVFVTHDQEEALEIADRVVVMNQGQIEQVGTPEEVYKRPSSAFVHEFIGESIAVPVAVRDGAVLFGGRPLALDAKGARNGPGRLFVRPDEMAIVTPDKAAFTGEVRHIHGLGPDRRLTVALAGTPETVVEIAAPRGIGAGVGETVSLAPRRYRIFDFPG